MKYEVGSSGLLGYVLVCVGELLLVRALGQWEGSVVHCTSPSCMAAESHNTFVPAVLLAIVYLYMENLRMVQH